MSDTVDQLPALEAPYPISAEQREAYQEAGHILLRSVASPEEVAAYRQPIADFVTQSGLGDVPLAQRDAYHQAFLQVGNVWEHDRAVARFTCAKRFAKVAADLMGVDGVRLYHDQALFKEPGGGMTFWHQDQYYWPLDTRHTITMWMPLVDCPVEMGVLTFASGSHVDGLLCDEAISADSDAEIRRILDERKFNISFAPLQAGDATFHSGWTLHTAPPNKTDRMREVMTVIYFADGTRILEPDNPHRPADLERWFPGQKPGEVAGTEINPLLYSRERDG
jgi:ectoine hydroxylase-related dioxygenase (phytanoyl-CoA dioxygenase family)